MSVAKDFYTKQDVYYQQLAEKYIHLSKQLSMLRVLWFTLWFVAIWYATRFNLLMLNLVIFLGLGVFIGLIIYHNKMISKKTAFLLYLEINRRELAVLNHKYSDLDDGKEYVNESHQYSYDIDIFGSFSLFQYLNRSFSLSGKKNIAQRLQHGFDKAADIQNTQKAVQELAEQNEWMQDFRVLGLQTKAGQEEKAFSVKELTAWAMRQSFFNRLAFKIAIVILPLLSWLMLYFLIAGAITSSNFLVYLLTPIGFSGFFAKKINAQHHELGKQASILQKWKQVFAFVEKKDFQSAELIKLRKILKQQEQSAHEAIKKLASLSQAFDTRYNIIGWFILNYLFSWDIYQSIRLDIWRKKNGEHIQEWFDAIASLEALVSFAHLKFNDASMTFPEISKGHFVYTAKNAAHLLMPKQGRVANDIDFDHDSIFTIVTGANMAGKSTYLRTVGMNMVLALAGAPVCAESMTIAPIQLFTSIRTKDSLAKNESYFYAELKRLQEMIDELKSGQRLFIILDEILKGTNSKDKEMGSKALVAQLIELKAAGIIATHDLQLGALAKTFPQSVQNRCFEVDIHHEQLHFDYKLREGISQNLNATFLMKKMGIIPRH